MTVLPLLLFVITAVADQTARTDSLESPVGVHTFATLNFEEKAKYPTDFTHFDFANPNAPKGGTFNFGVKDRDYGSFVDNASGKLAPGSYKLYSSMLTFCSDDPYTYYPYTAKNFEMADDGSYVIFNLNEKATWNDPSDDNCDSKKSSRVKPKPLTADDVAFSFDVHKKQGRIGAQGRLSNVDSYQVLSPHRILFRLKEPDKNTIRDIGTMALYSKEYHSQPGHEAKRLDRNPPPGTGPYVLKSQDKSGLKYKRVCHWWGEKIPSQNGTNNFDYLNYKLYGDDVVTELAFDKGEIDYFYAGGKKEWPPNRHLLKEKLASGAVTAHEINFLGTKTVQTIEINNQNPALQDRHVRRALSDLYEVEYITQSLSHGNIAEKSYFAEIKGGVGSDEDIHKLLLEMKRAHQDSFPDEALKKTKDFDSHDKDYYGIWRQRQKSAFDEMQKAGWKFQSDPDDPSKKVWMKDGEKFPSLRFPSERANDDQIYVSRLKQFGFEVENKQIGPNMIQKLEESKTYDLINSDVFHTDVPGSELISRWHSRYADISGSNNTSATKSPVIDDLANRVVNAKSPEERKTAIGAFDRVLQAETPEILTYRPDGARLLIQNHFCRNFPLPEHGNSNLWGITSEAWWDQSVDRNCSK